MNPRVARTRICRFSIAISTATFSPFSLKSSWLTTSRQLARYCCHIISTLVTDTFFTHMMVQHRECCLRHRSSCHISTTSISRILLKNEVCLSSLSLSHLCLSFGLLCARRDIPRDFTVDRRQVGHGAVHARMGLGCFGCFAHFYRE